MITPSMMLTISEAAVSFATDFFEGHDIFLNSAFKPLKKGSFGMFVLSAITLSPYAQYASCKICNTSLFPYDQDVLSYPS
jgi:hypothetical protein